jgi:hypothetical protein
MKRTFVELVLLLDLTHSEDTESEIARWKENVQISGVAEGYTYARGDDDYTTEEFACDEMEFADDTMRVYDFMGSAYEAERFYGRDIVVFKHKTSGLYYVLEHEDLGTF